MDKTVKGAWIVHHTNKLQNVSRQSDFDNIFAAGKCGILLSAISASDEHLIHSSRIKTLAKASNINALELQSLLGHLEREGLIRRDGDKVHVLGVTNQSVLQHASNIFENFGPTAQEQAVIDLAEKASDAPCERTQISQELSDTLSLSSAATREVLELSEKIGFTDYQDIDDTTRLYFNGNIFRRDDTRKVRAVLDSLSVEEQSRLMEVFDRLRSSACLAADEVQRILGNDLFRRAIGVGLLDTTVVSNDAEELAYVSRPAAYSKYGNALVEDALDLAKAFVGSLTYGMTRSSYARGQITMLSALMNRLIAGGWVGPVAAIGQDYKVLELKGVVEVSSFRRSNRSGPNMRLLKREIGELALQAINTGDISAESLPSFPGATVTRFRGPEVEREKVRKRKDVPQNKQRTNDMLMSLRTGGISRGR